MYVQLFLTFYSFILGKKNLRSSKFDEFETWVRSTAKKNSRMFLLYEMSNIMEVYEKNEAYFK